ncbi:MAG: S1/P1 Nuclease [Chitinophagaceae bacterium]|nr:MAG: S1/P1 Nuclease [Chitinophagaceae bacterium]
MNTFKKIVIVALICYLPGKAMAWGMLGHRIVGEIADRHLTKKARKAIAAILVNESPAITSNWADFIKSDTNYNYLSNWHYINLKGGMSQQEVENQLLKDTSTNAFTRINFLSSELRKGNLPKPTKLLYLRMLIHLVGDVHQPLHIGRPEDLGGNRTRVLWFNESYNLHQLWDDVLVSFQKLSYTEYATALNYVTKDQRRAWQQEPVTLWFYNSYQVAEKIYGDVVGKEDKLGYGYNFKYKSILDEQLLKGGIHLAGMLNDIFD